MQPFLLYFANKPFQNIFLPGTLFLLFGSDLKRLLGRRFDDRQLQDDLKTWPFTVIEQNDHPAIQVKYKERLKIFTPQELSAMILQKLKETAEAYLGCTVEDAVITIPAYFDDAQRKATMEAGKIAGLNVLQLLAEPTAAAVAYGLDKRVKEATTVLVYDLGGGTLDVSIMTIENAEYRVKSTFGNPHLGGQDFDNTMVDDILTKVQDKYGTRLKKNQISCGRLKAAVEQAKHALSITNTATVEVDSFCRSEDLHYSYSRAR